MEVLSATEARVLNKLELRGNRLTARAAELVLGLLRAQRDSAAAVPVLLRLDEEFLGRVDLGGAMPRPLRREAAELTAFLAACNLVAAVHRSHRQRNCPEPVPLPDCRAIFESVVGKPLKPGRLSAETSSLALPELVDLVLDKLTRDRTLPALTPELLRLALSKQTSETPSALRADGTVPSPALEGQGIVSSRASEDQGIVPSRALEDQGIAPSPASEDQGIVPAPASEGEGSIPSPASEDQGIVPSPASEDQGIVPSRALEGQGIVPAPASEDQGIVPSPASEGQGIVPSRALEGQGIVLAPASEDQGIVPSPASEGQGIVPSPASEDQSSVLSLALREDAVSSPVCRANVTVSSLPSNGVGLAVTQELTQSDDREVSIDALPLSTGQAADSIAISRGHSSILGAMSSETTFSSAVEGNDLSGLELRLSNVILFDVPRRPGRLAAIESLCLVGGGISVLDCASLNIMPSLTRLDISNNRIHGIEGRLELRRLTWVDFSHNDLVNVSALVLWNSVRYLDLSHNKISDPSGLPVSLESLRICDNQMRSALSLRILCISAELKNLDISGNPVMQRLPSWRVRLVSLLPRLAGALLTALF